MIYKCIHITKHIMYIIYVNISLNIYSGGQTLWFLKKLVFNTVYMILSVVILL